MTTLFTRIIDGEIPGRFVWADDVAVAFATIAPITDGHTLVVPRAEIDQLTDAPDDVLAHLVRVAKTIGRAQQSAWDAPRAALLVAGFEVPHLHLHVLPAWDEASLTFANARPDLPPDELDAAAERLRAALVAQGDGAHVPVSLGSPDLA
jgi:diadenosine tetraphosphate (Ap4A) HIT family hydrolase